MGWLDDSEDLFDEIGDALGGFAEALAARPDPLMAAREAGVERRAKVAFRKLTALRAKRYMEYLTKRVVEENAPAGVAAAIPTAVKIGFALVYGDHAVARSGWRELVKLAGASDAEWLVAELITSTELVPTTHLWIAARTWSAAVKPPAPATPKCMGDEAGPGPPSRDQPRW